MECRNREARLSKHSRVRSSRRHSCRGVRAPIRNLAPRPSSLSGPSENKPTPFIRRRVMRQTEPPSTKSSLRTSLFLIGKDSRGNWVVQDQRGMCGGLFVDRAEALRFALFENGKQPQAVVMVPGVFELDMNRKARTPQPPPLTADAPREQRAA